MAVYYRRFIQDFAKIAAPLHALNKKDAPFRWTDECQKAFDMLKSKLTSKPILAHPNYDKPYILHTDAYTSSLGAILSQKDAEEKEHPICYLSRQLTSAESNYSATELECLVAVWAIRKLHAFLDSAKFELVTDHTALQSLFNFKGHNRRLAKWMLDLTPHKARMKITYRPGRVHSNVDPLSRAALPIGEGEAEINVLDTSEEIASPQPFSWDDAMTGALSSYSLSFPQEALLQQIRKLNRKDPFASKMIAESMVRGKTRKDRTEEEKKFWHHDGLLWRRKVKNGPSANGSSALAVPDQPRLKLRLLMEHHDSMLGGHLGVAKTYERISHSFWWEGLSTDVKAYVTSCTTCQRNNASTQRPAGLLMPISVEQRRWGRICNLHGLGNSAAHDA